MLQLHCSVFLLDVYSVFKCSDLGLLTPKDVFGVEINEANYCGNSYSYYTAPFFALLVFPLKVQEVRFQ